MQVIYLDVLFIINLIMDFLIFFTVTLIMNKWLSIWRQLVAALMASVLYCLLIIVPCMQSIPYTFYSLWIPVIPILFLYRPYSYKEFGKYFLICTGVAAIYGGVVFNLWYIFGGNYYKIQSMNLMVLIGISVCVALLFYMNFYWIRRCFIFKRFSYKLILKRKRHEKVVSALLDTGNLLYTPISHHPVIVVTYEAVKALLTAIERENIAQFFKCKDKEVENYLMLDKAGPDVLIPFNSIGCKQGFLWGINIDEVKVMTQVGEKVIHHCVVGISKEPLYSDKQYEALLHPEYILEGEVAI